MLHRLSNRMLFYPSGISDRKDRHRIGSGWHPLSLTIPLLAASLAILIASCTQEQKPSKPADDSRPKTSVTVFAAKRGDVSGTLLFSGDVRAKSAITIVPKTSGEIRRMNVDVGTRVKAGDVLAELDAVPVQAQARQAEAALAAAQARLAGLEAGPRVEQVAQAKASLDVAVQRLASLRNGPRDEVVAQAAANLRAAESRARQLKDGPTAEQRRVAEMNVEGAKVKVHSANVQKDGDCAPIKPDYLCKASQAAAIAAAYQLDAAQAQYESVIAPPTPEQLTQAQAAVDAAREQHKLAQNPYTEQDIAQAEDAVRIAEQQLRLAQNPFTAHDLDGARAQVAQARAALDVARYQADQAQILSPVNGVVADRFLTQGSLASSATPIFSLIADEIEVVFGVDERQVGQLAVGMPVNLTVSAFPAETFLGTITSIAPTIDPRTRTSTLKVVPASNKLKPGMFAQLKVTAQQRQSVTLVPKEAIAHRSGKAVLFTVVDGKAKMIEAATGLSDDKFIEILRGIEPGAEVVVSGHSDLFDNDQVNVSPTKTS